MSGPARVLLCVGSAVGLLVGGAVVGLAAVALHVWWLGLALSIAACVAVLVALPRAWSTRPPFTVGVVVVVGRATVPRPEGDYLIAADGAGYALLIATLVLILATVVTLPRPRSRPRPEPAGRGDVEVSTPVP